MKNIILVLFIMASVLKSQTPSFKWAKSMGGMYGDQSMDVCVDASGNVHTTGYSQGGDFDPGPGTYTFAAKGTAGIDVFVSKLDSNGNFLWARTFGGVAPDYGNAIGVDSSGNVYTTGQFSLTADFDPGAGTYNLTSTGKFDIFISKLDAAGNFVWAKNIGGIGNDYGFKLIVNPAGDIVISGSFQDSVDMDPGSGIVNLKTSYIFSHFILKLNAQGNFVWAYSYDPAYVSDIASDPSGNIFTTGLFMTPTDFNLGTGVFTLAPVYLYDAFVSKMDAAGNFLWAKSIGDSADEQAASISLDRFGNIYSTGKFTGKTDLDPGPGSYTIKSVGSDMYFSKLDPSGNFLWAKTIDGTQSDGCVSIVLDTACNLLGTGVFDGTTDFDPGTPVNNLTSAGQSDIFIIKLDSAGNFIWVTNIGASNLDRGNAVTVDKQNNLYTTGYFRLTSDFQPGSGTTTLTSAGHIDVFVLKYGYCDRPPLPVDVTPQNNKFICENSSVTLSVSGSGSINWFATSSSTTSIHTGNSYVTQPLIIGTHTFYTEAETCINSDSRTAITVTVDACLGIANYSSTENSLLRISPNPNAGILFVESEVTCEFVIINSNGAEIKRGSIQAGREMLDLSGTPPGIYFLKTMIDGQIVSVKKIIREE